VDAASFPQAEARDHHGTAPPKVRAVLAQKLFIETARLPSPLINQIKRLAAFQNPECYKKQSMRLSTTTTPRVIACWLQEFNDGVLRCRSRGSSQPGSGRCRERMHLSAPDACRIGRCRSAY
jgi:hypothetical protein